MIKNTKKFFNIASAIVLGSIVLWNCEPDADSLGSQFFSGGEAVDDAYAIIAYNVNNNDSIRSDASKLDSAVIGAFSEPQFGMQKASYVTQLRFSSSDPTFGTNPVLDSAVLVIKPAYVADSVKTTTIDDYVYHDATHDSVAAKKEVVSYPIRKYGNEKIAGNDAVFNVKVHEVDDFLGAATDKVFSNKTVSASNLIGSKTFKGIVSSVKITKDDDGSELFTREVGMRIPLDSAFIANKIIAKAGKQELSDAASFIRYFRGIRLSVDENDGYLFKFDPDALELNLYYKNESKDDDGNVKKIPLVMKMSLGSPNTHFTQYAFDRTGTPYQNTMASIDNINGDSKLYLQGAGGAGAGFKIPEATIASLKDKFKNDKIGIISAKIRIYTDENLWKNSYPKPNYFIVRQADSYKFLTDLSTLPASGVYNLVKTYDLGKNPAHYDIGITQTIKNIIEKEEAYKDFIINVGMYTYDSSGNFLGSTNPDAAQNYNTRTYTPNRAVFVGTVTNTADPLYNKGAKLLITYGKK